MNTDLKEIIIYWNYSILARGNNGSKDPKAGTVLSQLGNSKEVCEIGLEETQENSKR